MKRALLILVIFTFVGCNKNKKEEVKSDITSDQIALGEKLFNERTCTNCHTLDNNDLGPSIKNIVKIYSEQNKDIVTFLKGDEKHSIVEKDSNQVAVMKNNIDDFVKDFSNDELQAISAYMLDIAK